MSVIRIKHNRENPYVQLNKSALWDCRLSLKATGLWARCLARPDDWRFNIKELASKCKEGRRAIDGAIHELILCDYAIRLEHWEKSEDGKFTTGGVEYVFFEFPATQQDKDEVLEEFKKSFRHCGFGNCRNGYRRNSNLLNNHETNTDSSSSSSRKLEEDFEEAEPNRTEPKKEGGMGGEPHPPSDRIGSNGSAFSLKEDKSFIPSLEEIEMVTEHASKASAGKIVLKHSDIRIWVGRYGLEKTIMAVDLAVQDIRSGSLLTNPAGWITNALKKNY